MVPLWTVGPQVYCFSIRRAHGAQTNIQDTHTHDINNNKYTLLQVPVVMCKKLV